MRERGSLLAAAVMAAAGVLTLPIGAAATEGPAPTQGPPPSESPTPDPTVEPGPEAGDVTVVDDAVFAWSLSEQTNARSHNPGAINFLAAGEANPGRGGAILPKSRWMARSGAVAVQKRTLSGAWKSATWEGLGTDARGGSIGLLGPFSGHRVSIAGGTGSVDAVAEDATLSWKGTFSVVYYGGNSVFTLTDPTLEVRAGHGTLRATAGGWAADRADPSTWLPVPRQVVSVAVLSQVDITEKGLAITPEYGGREVVGTEPQKRTGADWGAFPQELITFLEPLGTDQFWYSTGLQSDWTKKPAPVQVGWQGVEPPASAPPKPREPVEEPTNPVRDAPDPPRSPQAQRVQASAQPSETSVLDVPLEVVPGGVAFAPVQVSAAAAGAPATLPSLSSSVPWVVGGVLLLASALLLLMPLTGRAPR